MSRFLSKLTGKTRIVHVFTFIVHQIQGLSSGTKEVAIQISRKGTNKLQVLSVMWGVIRGSNVFLAAS